MEPRLFRLTAVMLCACGGAGGGDGADRSTRIAGAASWSGPVRGATVVAYQLVDGERTLEVARAPTGEDGSFSLSTGMTYEHVELDVIGGRYDELAGGSFSRRRGIRGEAAGGEAAGGEAAGGVEVVLDGDTVLRGTVLDLVIGEERGGVVVSPWTHVAVELGHARLRSGEDATYGAAVGTALARLRVHTGFDVAGTPVASLAVAAASPTDDVRHGLTLGGLSELAALAAAEQGATVQSVNTVELTRVLARDAASAEARLDGNGDEALFVGAACPPPAGCVAEGPGCYAACAVHASTLRARLGGAVLSFLLGPENGTGLARDDLGPWLEAMRSNVDPQLFGGEAPEPFDARGPVITWHAPVESAVVSGAIAVEVSTVDPVGVASLAVTAGVDPPLALVDTDPAPDRFAATLATAGLPEGALILTATARDTENNEAVAERPVVVDNLAGGTISGVVFKGRVGGAAVRVYGFAGGVRGALLGEGTTAADGTFANLRLADGHSGPLLVEAGFGGTYGEEAASATVTLDVADRLRTVVPAYSDGGAISGVTVSPLTSFAVTYGEYLGASGQGGATVAERWATARGAMEAHFGVASIGGVVPQAPAEMSTFNAPARYGLVLVGLSELARAASTLGGGDGGTFGPAMSSLRVVRALELDLADGCWDGRQGTAPLYFGGTQAVSARATRLGLATAIAAYLDDGARNQTPYAGAADVLALLDTLASGGGNGAPGGCAATGGLHPDAGSAFDQTPPAIAISTAPAGPVLGGVVTVTAVASDALDVRPSLRFTAPAGTVDSDGDAGDADATAAIDTRVFLPGTEGTLAVSLESFDDAGNRGTGTLLMTVDNRAPEVAITGVGDGAWYSGAVTPVVSASDGHLASFAVTLDGAPWSAGSAVSAEGRHVLVAAALDAAGNTTTRTVTFHVDLTDPTLAAAPAWPPWLRGTATLRVLADDTLRSVGSLGADIAVTATGAAGPLSVAATPALLPGGQRQLDVAVDTAAAGDGGLTVRFDVVDRAGRAAAPLVIARQIDNTPPAVALLPVRNQAGVQIDGFVSEPAAQIRGTTTPGGSPVTVTVTVNPGAITATATPDATGAWSVLTPPLGEGSFTVSATAVDGAGNPSPGPAAAGFIVDRTAPTLGLLQSTALDERHCDVAVNVAVATGTVGAAPVTYGACDGTGSPIRLDTITAAVGIGKFTTRLTGGAADNPLTFLPQATDGAGVGLSDAPTSIQYRVYRTGQSPPAAWAATAAPVLANGVLSAQATATAALAPELRTHTAPFTVELRATDRLGNTSTATLTRTWMHHPLAPPVLVRYVAPTDPDDPALGGFSLFKHSLTPTASQVGLAGAMSSGFLADAPRGLYELEVWNPHPEPVNVGFYIPSFSGVTYATRVWEVNPYISGSAGLVNTPPAGTCGWPARTTVFRLNGGAAPFTCGSGTTCTCLAGPLADSKPAATTGSITTTSLRIVAWDATPAIPVRLTPQSLSPTVDGHTFYEFTIPARASPTSVASHLRLMIALPNLDLFSPSDDVANQLVLESDGAGAEVHIFRSGNTSFSPTMTAVFKERWADCYAYNATTDNCTDMHARRRLRATVQVALDAPMGSIAANVRTRAIAATSASPERVPDESANDGQLQATHAAAWSSCETTFPLSCPTIPDHANGAAF